MTRRLTTRIMTPNANRTALLLKELTTLYLDQTNRIRHVSPDPADTPSTSLAAGVGHVPHAVGKRKPSLSELDNQPPRFRRRMF